MHCAHVALALTPIQMRGCDSRLVHCAVQAQKWCAARRQFGLSTVTRATYTTDHTTYTTAYDLGIQTPEAVAYRPVGTVNLVSKA